jgi:hypothetical protein
MSGVITGYATLQTSVADWLAKSNLTSFIPAFIQNFEERFLRQPRNYGKWMESSALSVSFSSTATVPTDYLSARIFYLNGQVRRPLVVSSLEQLYAKYPRGGSSGIPAWIARDGANFVFGPVPNGTFTLNGTYYAKPVLLRNFASDAAAHFLIVNAPDLLLYGALLEAVPFIKDDNRIPIWQGFFDRALQDYRDLMKAQNFSGGAMQVLVA